MEKAAEKIDCKYMDFFENLRYIYEKEINGQKYIFSHAHVSEKRLDKFLTLDRYDEFHKYLLENDVYLYFTPIWERKCEYKEIDEEFVRIRDYVIVHGHTPVAIMDQTPEYVKKYKIPYIEADRIVEAKEAKTARYIGDESILEFDIKIDDIYGINIDTGISIGHGLSALGIKTENSSRYSWAREDDGAVEYTVIQARSDLTNKAGAYMRNFKYRLMK